MPNGSTGLVLIDSNILVYAVDPREATKALTAIEVIKAVEDASAGITNSQVLIEFVSASTRADQRRGPNLTAVAAEQWVEKWLAILEFRPITEAMFRDAARGAAQHQMDIFDAQIWAAARASGARVVSEDMQSAAIIEGVEYVNPFLPDFTMAHLGL
jgi:predicted nucleic acid-binding protein